VRATSTRHETEFNAAIDMQNLAFLRRKFVSDFVTCFLIIVAHFTNYIIYANYTKLVPDIALVVIIFCACALLLAVLLQIPSFIFRSAIYATLITIVFSDAIYEYGTSDTSIRLIAMSATLLAALGLVFFLREHANKVLIGVFAAMFISTIVVGLSDARVPDVGPDTARNGSSDSPNILHLILDEHMGSGGLTARLPGGAAIKQELRDFYIGGGFRLFSHAYSQYFKTSSSLASAMSFDSSGKPQQFITQKRYGFILKKNEYFKYISEKKYNIKVLQSDYFDFCNSIKVKIKSCVTYRPDSFKFSAIKNLELMNRINLILNMYYNSFAVMKLLKLGEKPAFANWLAEQGIAPFHFGFWHGRVGPIAVAPALETLATELAAPGGRTLYFAHLLLPHYPYVYTSECLVRSPIASWRLRYRFDETNSQASRRQRYEDYFEQIRCTMRKLEKLFDTMKRNGSFENTIIIIHGDHGSRIGLFEPSAANLPSMKPDDFIDGFSTLFAIKAPGVLPGLDKRMLSLSQLIQYAAHRNDRRLSEPTPPRVYLPNRAGGLTPVTLPEFPASAAEGPDR
jgi:hypothetical protein